MSSLAERIGIGAAAPSSSNGNVEVEVELKEQPVQNLIIIADRDLTVSEQGAIIQHGALMRLSDSDLPPITVNLSQLLAPKGSELRILFINLSHSAQRRWTQIRTNEINQFTHVILRKKGETDKESWMQVFDKCTVLKQIESAFSQSDFVSQLLNFQHIPKPVLSIMEKIVQWICAAI